MNLKEEILARTNQGLEVFCFYMPIDFVPKRNFRNPLYDDRRASCNIYLDPKTQCYHMKDFGNDMYSGDCFWFAASMLGLDVKTDFPRLLEQIVEDLHLNISVAPKQERHSSYKETPEPQKEKASKKPFKLYAQAFSTEELRFWGRYGITAKILERYNVHSLARYESVSSQGKPFALHSTADEPMFAYVLGDFVKLYRPMSKIRFLYGGNKSEDYVFGFEQLPSKGDVLFITGGEKDVLSLAAHHFHAICFNSETALIPERIIESLQLRFRHIVLLYDTDETGQREAKRQCELLDDYGVISLSLPLEGSKAEKDVANFFALGKTEADLRVLLAHRLSETYTQTMMMLRSCEIDYDNPPDASKSVVSVNGVPLGTQDNRLIIATGVSTSW